MLVLHDNTGMVQRQFNCLRHRLLATAGVSDCKRITMSDVEIIAANQFHTHTGS